MTEYKVASRTCVDPEGRTRQFHYYLTVDLEESPRFCMEHYGVKITEEPGPVALHPAITTSPTHIDELITLLADNTVGPAGADDVIREWA